MLQKIQIKIITFKTFYNKYRITIYENSTDESISKIGYVKAQ